MRNIWTIAKRELKAYFISPIAYVLIFMIMLTLSIFFFIDIYYAVNTQGYIPDIKRTLELLVFPLFFLAIPAITMRTMAEENRMGTIELLLTAPVRDWELVIGKWLGSVLFFMIIIAITLIYPLVLNPMISPGVDIGLLASGYLGIILLMFAMCAIGVFISTLFSNLIAALIVSLIVILVLWIVGVPGQLLTNSLGSFLSFLSFSDHYYNTFLTGILDLKDVVFYLTFTAMGLFFGTISVEVKRWK